MREINEKNYLKNKQVKFIGIDRVYDGLVTGINNEGELVLEEKGNIYNLRIGEVSTK